MVQKMIINRNKPGLYIKFLIRAYDAYNRIPSNSKKEYLDFNTLNSTICRNFSIPKSEVIEYLRIFEEFGYLTFVKYHGVKLNYIVKDVKNE